MRPLIPLNDNIWLCHILGKDSRGWSKGQIQCKHLVDCVTNGNIPLFELYWDWQPPQQSIVEGSLAWRGLNPATNPLTPPPHLLISDPREGRNRWLKMPNTWLAVKWTTTKTTNRGIPFSSWKQRCFLIPFWREDGPASFQFSAPLAELQ